MTHQTITIDEAHERWGDLARIRNGHTHWVVVIVHNGKWHPVKHENLFSPDHYVFVPDTPNSLIGQRPMKGAFMIPEYLYV